MTEPTLTKMSALGMSWLGRLPTTFGRCDQLIDQAWNREEPWVEVGTLAAKRRTTSARYRAQTFDTTL